jgi:hypothetical protein
MICIPPENLHEHWSYVRAGLEIVRRRAGGDWLPEDVYTALKNGNSLLYKRDTGFVVVTPIRDFDGTTAFIWAAYEQDRNFQFEVVPEVIEICRELGARRIRWDSTRKGWARHYRAVSTTYELEL